MSQSYKSNWYAIYTLVSNNAQYLVEIKQHLFKRLIIQNLPNRPCLSYCGFMQHHCSDMKVISVTDCKTRRNKVSHELQQCQRINSCDFDDEKKNSWTKGRCFGTLAMTDYTIVKVLISPADSCIRKFVLRALSPFPKLYYRTLPQDLRMLELRGVLNIF